MYGGRTSDKHIVRDSGFYDILEPVDQVMADRGFKLETDLAMIQYYLGSLLILLKGRKCVRTMYVHLG